MLHIYITYHIVTTSKATSAKQPTKLKSHQTYLAVGVGLSEMCQACSAQCKFANK